MKIAMPVAPYAMHLLKPAIRLCLKHLGWYEVSHTDHFYPSGVKELGGAVYIIEFAVEQIDELGYQNRLRIAISRAGEAQCQDFSKRLLNELIRTLHPLLVLHKSELEGRTAC